LPEKLCYNSENSLLQFYKVHLSNLIEVRIILLGLGGSFLSYYPNGFSGSKKENIDSKMIKNSIS